MLEREGELAELEWVLEATEKRSGWVVVVDGAAGIGKSRLLEAAKERAERRGMVVLGGRASRLERDFALGVARQLLGPSVRRLSAARREKLERGRQGVGLAALEGAGGGEGSGAMAILHALHLFTVDLAADHPLLLAVDDLHWADAPSLRLLEYLSRRLDDERIALVLTTRPDEPGAEHALIASIAASASTTRLCPSPLSVAAVGDLLARELDAQPHSEFVRACEVTTGGNPFLVRELALALGRAGVQGTASDAAAVAEIAPQAVADAVSRRMADLAPREARLARAVAVLGDGAGLDEAARLADLDRTSAEAAFEALRRVEVLTGDRRLSFVHPLVRDAVAGAIAPDERATLHQRAAAVVAGAGAPSERVAVHLLQAPVRGDPEVVSRLRGAAGEALARGGLEAAVAFLRRALMEGPGAPERVAISVELARAEALVDSEAAIARLTEALDLVADPGIRCELAAALIRIYVLLGRAHEAARTGEEALREAPDADHRRQLQAAILAAAAFRPDLRALASELVAAGAAIDRPDSLGERMLAVLAAFSEARSGNLPAADAVARIDSCFSPGLLEFEGAAGAFACAVLTAAAADSPLARSLADRRREIADRHGSVLLTAGARMFGAYPLVATGSLEGAIAEASSGLEAIELFAVGGIGPPYAAAPLVEALVAKGRLDDAQAALDRAGPVAPGAADGNAHPLLCARGLLAEAREEWRAALEEARALGVAFEELGGRNPAFIPWRSLAARCLAALGQDLSEARSLATEEVELARAWGAPRALGRALRSAALAQGGTEGVDLLREAVAVTEDSAASLELARGLVQLGAALRHRGADSDARPMLRRAADIAAHCGATALAERARDELVAAGGRPRRRAITGPDALTAAERRIAELAAGGDSNGEIADKVVVSAKTVEGHLTRVYRKLGVSSRAQLAAALDDSER